MFKINLPLKSKWLLVTISISFGVIACFLLISFFHTFSGEQEFLVGEGQLQVDSDEFIGLKLKIPGAEKNGHWELNVARLESKNDLGLMKEINGDYLLDKKPVYHISAESGIIQWETKILQIAGQVSFKTNDGKTLRAEEVSWDPNTRRIRAKKKVVLESPDVTVTTDQIDGDLNFNRAEMTGMTKVFYRR